MRIGLTLRLLLSAFVAGAIALSDAKPMPQPTAVAAATQAAPRATIRVGMWTLWHDRRIVAAPGADARVRLCANCAARLIENPATVRAEGNDVVVAIGGATRRSARLWLTGAFTLSARGETAPIHNPLAISAKDGLLVLAVTLSVESYVERVVAGESNSTDSPETLKALAIVVRSYALHEAHGHADYDVCDSTHCQLMHWNRSPSAATRAENATLATAGETLWYRSERALSYFSKDCGGRTASPAEVWPRAQPVSYLPSQTDPFCVGGGGQQWATEISRAELTSALAARGLVAPGWQQLTVARRAESGRAVTLRLDSTEIAAEEFRLAVGEALGWNRIPSTWFEVSRNGDQFAFHGRGWGHGVGLCQKGAAAMGAQGRTSAEILAQYFPGANAADEATGRTWRTFAASGFTLETLDRADAVYLPELAGARAEASQRSGLNASQPFTVRAFASTPAFRDATLEPGWIAAFAQGDWIGTQPLRTLAARHLLVPTLRHEFLHALIERQAGPDAPLWFREGLAETWSASRASDSADRAPHATMPAISPTLKIDALDGALAHAESEAESQAAHHAAAWYVAHLLDRYGRTQVLEWLHSDIPAGVLAALRQR
jgi:stage II sporulation protein D